MAGSIASDQSRNDVAALVANERFAWLYEQKSLLVEGRFAATDWRQSKEAELTGVIDIYARKNCHRIGSP